MGTAPSPNNLGRLQPILGGMTQTRRGASLLMLMPLVAEWANDGRSDMAKVFGMVADGSAE